MTFISLWFVAASFTLFIASAFEAFVEERTLRAGLFLVLSLGAAICAQVLVP